MSFSVRKISPALWRGFFVSILALILFTTCKEEPVISQPEKNTFIHLMIGMAKARVEFGKNPDKYTEATDQLFEESGVDREYIDKFLAKIASHPDIQETIFLEISDSLQTLEQMITLEPDSKPDSIQAKPKFQK